MRQSRRQKFVESLSGGFAWNVERVELIAQVCSAGEF
jgi:hypothetical protein